MVKRKKEISGARRGEALAILKSKIDEKKVRVTLLSRRKATLNKILNNPRSNPLEKTRARRLLQKL